MINNVQRTARLQNIVLPDMYYMYTFNCTMYTPSCTVYTGTSTLPNMKKKKVKNSLKFLFCILLENWSFIILRIQFHREMKILYPSVLQIRGENREGLQGCQ